MRPYKTSFWWDTGRHCIGFAIEKPNGTYTAFIANDALAREAGMPVRITGGKEEALQVFRDHEAIVREFADSFIRDRAPGRFVIRLDGVTFQP